MPPTRTMPPAKAVKTERTHEENQERAYIAASRRSDRSLEARVESARRASEIHKRRTGRSLRVTEQDVVNEEMYEEEDDDLPMQYRRLTAHLQTGSVEFNRRLAAYLTNQVAMRSAMDQMINNSYAQQYPNAPQFAHNDGQSSFPPPLANGAMTRSPTNTHRAAPYPSPHQAGFKHPHARSYSTATPEDSLRGGAPRTSGPPFADPERRMSTPAGASSPLLSRTLKTDDIKPDPDDQRQTQSARPGLSHAYPPLWQDMGPFTTSLPPESQQMLGPALDPRDPMTSMLMAGSDTYNSGPYYPWGTMQNPSKLDMTQPSFDGMFSTLAPSALEDSDGFSAASTKPSSGCNESTTAPPSTPHFNFNHDNTNFKSMSGLGPGLARENSASGLGSGQITPGEAFWDSFVQDDGWGDEAATTAN